MLQVDLCKRNWDRSHWQDSILFALTNPEPTYSGLSGLSRGICHLLTCIYNICIHLLLVFTVNITLTRGYTVRSFHSAEWSKRILQGLQSFDLCSFNNNMKSSFSSLELSSFQPTTLRVAFCLVIHSISTFGSFASLRNTITLSNLGSWLASITTSYNDIDRYDGVLSPEDLCPSMPVINLKDGFASPIPVKGVRRSTGKKAG